MFRIKKLDIFIAKQFGLLFFATFFICQFVLMMQFLWRYVDELIGKGLSLEVMAQFFWYMGLMLMPQAFPLAILLSSLITFGNLGESSELTAIKAAGISLLQAMRSLIVIVIAITCISFFFQEVIAPKAFISFRQLLLSMKQKNPEVEIPEGIFYDGIPGSNLYVQKKDMKTGMLYGIMIYRMNGSYDDAAVILADSGRMQPTAEKKHLLLTLYSGEWFENMRQSGLGVAANVPYRRETFSTKNIGNDSARPGQHPRIQRLGGSPVFHGRFAHNLLPSSDEEGRLDQCAQAGKNGEIQPRLTVRQTDWRAKATSGAHGSQRCPGRTQ